MTHYPLLSRQLIFSGILCGAALVFGQLANAAPSASGPDAMPAAPAIAPASTLPSIAGPRVEPIAGITDRGADDTGCLLGDVFEDKVKGLAFRPPAGCEPIKNDDLDDIANYSNKLKSCYLRVTRRSLSAATPLVTKEEVGKETTGYTELVLKELRMIAPEIHMLRGPDLTNIGPYSAVLFAFRYAQGTQRWLRQELIVQLNEQSYYRFSFITLSDATPAPAANPDASPADDVPGPREIQAVNSFNAMVDSIKFLDRGSIFDEQVQRLYRTRALFVQLNAKKLTAALVPQQYLRFIKDGKDVGWTYVEEMTGQQRRDLEQLHRNDPKPLPVDNRIAVDGLVIYTRSFRALDAGNFGESSSELFVSFDRRREMWVQAGREGRIDPASGKDITKVYNTVFGEGSHKQKMDFDVNPKDDRHWGVGDADDPKNPRHREVEVYTLNISAIGKQGNPPPKSLEPAAWYVPQAIGHLLPRLVPLDEAKSYMFASYVPEVEQFMSRYIEVSLIRQYTFNGHAFWGVTVSDRLGWEGPKTIHYFATEKGKTRYMGSENRQDNIQVLPSDHDEILKLWPRAILTKPDYFEKPSEN